MLTTRRGKRVHNVRIGQAEIVSVVNVSINLKLNGRVNRYRLVRVVVIDRVEGDAVYWAANL